MRNIELKVKLNLKDIKAYLDTIKPSYIGRLKQKDTYFLLGNERLKIREENDKAELIYYVRENKAESRDSRYFILRLNKHFLGSRVDPSLTVTKASMYLLNSLLSGQIADVENGVTLNRVLTVYLLDHWEFRSLWLSGFPPTA